MKDEACTVSSKAYEIYLKHPGCAENGDVDRHCHTCYAFDGSVCTRESSADHQHIVLPDDGCYFHRTKAENDHVHQLAMDATLADHAHELFDALREAAYEMCHQNGLADDMACDGWDAEKECCTHEKGKCFVQKWWNVLKKAKGEDK